ncbi:MAG TPA: PH domain-containing protein [Anaerolineales bacterium]|nr:PH domain-containing protein [Anaerolineales bacterium]
MDTIFLPPKRRGLVFQGTVQGILLVGSILTIWQANRVGVGASFGGWLLLFLACTLPLPVLAYRAYALQRAAYHLSPEGIRLHWGLRTEEIPMSKILWLSTDAQLERPLPLPWLYWPGGVLGVRKVGAGEVEYMSAQARNLLVIATPGKMYAISPEHPEDFLHAFQRQAEIGTLNPIAGRSIYPTVLVGSVWASRPARGLILAGFLLILALLIWMPLAFPAGNVSPLISQPQVVLLPIVNVLFFLVNLLLGLFFFRNPQSQPLAYLLWGGSVLTSLLFFGAFMRLM